MKTTIGSILVALTMAACGGGGGSSTPGCMGAACGPAVNVAAPMGSVSGTVTLTASPSAVAPATVKSVQFRVDANALGAPVVAPYTINWDTTTIGDGFHQVSAVVTDSGNLTGTSANVSFPVSNTKPAPWQAGFFSPEANFAAHCAVPRSGNDPITNTAYPDLPGSLLYEKNWLRSWTNDLYLWFSEVPDQDPAQAQFTDTLTYFAVLKTPALTPSGAPKDKFHFTYSTAAWEALSQNGVQAGYGLQWVIISPTPPRKVVVAYTEPNSPATAASANLARGASVTTIDGVDINDNTAAGISILNAGLSPSAVGQTHTFGILDLGAASARTVSLTSANVTSTPVQNVGTVATGSGAVGYMLFNDHLATSEGELVTAFRTLQMAGVSDLVLDIRYNGGGYLAIASEVAYMIAGAGPTTGQTFELPQFNSKHPTVDPVTGQTIVPAPFFNVTQGFSTTAGVALPTLNLPRVFVLTGPDTCSASEAVMNGLRGVNVQVIQVGSTTCGKPYAFYPQDNCGATYFSIEIKGVNAMAFGDYPDGFTPQNATVAAGVSIPGCSVADDFTHALGAPAEGRLAAALGYRAGGTCPAATGLGPNLLAASLSSVDGRLLESPLRTLRLMRR